jgi:hypothetical protein
MARTPDRMEHQKRVKTLRRYRSIAVKPDDHILHAGTPSTTPHAPPSMPSGGVGPCPVAHGGDLRGLGIVQFDQHVVHR